MFDHVVLPVSDLEASARFYATVLRPLGLDDRTEGEDYVEFGALVVEPRPDPQPLHIAFIAESRDGVDAFHRAGVDAGYRDNGPPGIRHYAPDYYAAFLLDPDGHNVEAVHRSEETRAGWSWLGAGIPPRVDPR
ncbi:MAG TPA: VOC family protein [Solirubrobacterales bacterium]|nr:VOC family protein [Solirubrobacterales bacterium]